MPLQLDFEAIRECPLPPQEFLASDEYPGQAGTEHYRLLAWLSTQWQGVELFDLGTHHGASAQALAYNPANTVVSFDLENRRRGPSPPNVTFVLANLWTESDRQTWLPRLLQSPLIFLDVDPHNGTMERELYQVLVDHQYTGLLLCDDIWYFPDMRRRFWSHVDRPKVDLTRVGHWSGTGLIDFSSQVVDPYPSTAHWTLVTAYFDLTQEPDASAAIKERPSQHYLESAHATMAVPQNLVVFCDAATRPSLEALRPAHLRPRTHFVVMNFTDFPLVTQCRDRIKSNRETHPYYFDPRNTPSYYLFCMTRYLMVDQILTTNPFKSTHFAWINLCIERMGWKNVAGLDYALQASRDKFSTCWIDYQPSSLVNNWAEYFTYGRCSMCSGFFTGHATYFRRFNQYVLQAFHDCLQAGYGHADEQLFSIVYFQHPDLFEPYFGDYFQMITNYRGIQDHPAHPLHIFIRHSFEHKDYRACQKACQALWPFRSQLSPSDQALYRTYGVQAAVHNGDLLAAQTLLQP